MELGEFKKREKVIAFYHETLEGEYHPFAQLFNLNFAW